MQSGSICATLRACLSGIVLLCGTISLRGQGGPPQDIPPDYGCWIRYEYDDAGNRTDRYWYCANVKSVQGNSSLDHALTVSPTPADQQARVRMDALPVQATLQVINSKGDVVVSRSWAGGELILDTDKLPTGAYFLRVALPDELLQHALVIVH